MRTNGAAFGLLLVISPFGVVSLLPFVSFAVASCGARTELEVATPYLDGDAADVAEPHSDAGADASAAADSGCGGDTTPQIVATFGTGDLGPSVFTFAVADGYAFVETSRSGNPLAIDRVPLTGGSPVTAILGQEGCPSASPFWSETPLATDGTTLYMVSADFSAACQGSSPTVSTYDVASGALGSIPPPVGPASFNVSGLRATSGRGAYYLTGSELDPSASDLVHWDGVTATTVSVLPEWCYDLQIVGDTAFILGAHALYQVSLAGGPTAVATPVMFGTGVSLIGANAAAVFYTPDGVHIVRRTPAGANATIASPANAHFGVSTAAVDDTYLYFGGPAGLLRVSVLGGAVETFWSTTRTTLAVTIVGCHVYWLADTDYRNSLPPELLVAPE